MTTRQKLSATIVSIVILSSAAQGGIYFIGDDVMSHVFWINTEGALYRYGNQLLLPAIITDYNGHLITTDAMVIYDAVWGTINLIHFGNYCIFATAWDNNGVNCTIAQTGEDDSKVAFLYDHIYRCYEPRSGKIFPDLRANPDFLEFTSGAVSGKDNVINLAKSAPDPVASANNFYLQNSRNNDRYYLNDTYRVGDPNFEFYIVTITVEPGDISKNDTEGLIFLQLLDWTETGAHYVYKVIITVFGSTHGMTPYSMAGIYDLQDSSEQGHYFAEIFGEAGGYTTVY